MNSTESIGFSPERTIPFVPEILAAPPVPASSPTGRAGRILIAEDDPVSQLLLSTRLQKSGYDVIVTSDGHAAMKAMRAPDAPALAIIDWMMPGMDGIEVCRRLREVNKVVYIIFLTARGTKENVFEALQAGADDYLVKPFDPLELQGRINVGFRIINLQKELTARVAELATIIEQLKAVKAQLSVPL